MPNTRTHDIVGGGAGLVLGLLALKRLNVPSHGELSFLLGAAAGSWMASRAPDAVEPALHSWHREFFHSVTAGAGVVTAGATAGAEYVRANLSCATVAAGKRAALDPQSPDGLALWWQEQAWYFAAGFVFGLPVGYVSHLLADMTTPRSIPLLGLRASA